MPAAVDTYFIERGQLMAQLRLSNVDEEDDIYAQVDAAIEEANVLFIDKVGLTRMATLSGYEHNKSKPTTLNEFLAVLARATYRRIVRIELMRTIVQAFKDGSTRVIHEWNNVGAFRNLSQFIVARQIGVEENRLLRAWPLLRGDREPGDGEGSFKHLMSDKPWEQRVIGASLFHDLLKDEWQELHDEIEELNS